MLSEMFNPWDLSPALTKLGDEQAQGQLAVVFARLDGHIGLQQAVVDPTEPRRREPAGLVERLAQDKIGSDTQPAAHLGAGHPLPDRSLARAISCAWRASITSK